MKFGSVHVALGHCSHVTDLDPSIEGLRQVICTRMAMLISHIFISSFIFKLVPFLFL